MKIKQKGISVISLKDWFYGLTSEIISDLTPSVSHMVLQLKHLEDDGIRERAPI